MREPSLARKLKIIGAGDAGVEPLRREQFSLCSCPRQGTWPRAGLGVCQGHSERVLSSLLCPRPRVVWKQQASLPPLVTSVSSPPAQVGG